MSLRVFVRGFLAGSLLAAISLLTILIVWLLLALVLGGSVVEPDVEGCGCGCTPGSDG